MNFGKFIVPEASIVVDDLAHSVVLARVAEAGVNLLLAVLAVESRRTATLILLEAEQVAGATVLARVGVADVAFGQDFWVSFVCEGDKRI